MFIYCELNLKIWTQELMKPLQFEDANQLRHTQYKDIKRQNVSHKSSKNLAAKKQRDGGTIKWWKRNLRKIADSIRKTHSTFLQENKSSGKKYNCNNN